MFRLRRYRVFIIFAIVAVGLFYHFSSINGPDNIGGPSLDQLSTASTVTDPRTATVAEEGGRDGRIEEKTENVPAEVPTRVASGHHEAEAPNDMSSKRSTSATTEQSLSGEENARTMVDSASRSEPTMDDINPVGHPYAAAKVTDMDASTVSAPSSSAPAASRLQASGEESASMNPNPTPSPKIHWSRQPEHFPIPTASVISLPSSKPRSIPQIQYNFKPESAAEKSSRAERLEKITNTFLHSWSGYRERAWLQDELLPRSGGRRNPFCGWAATLVDTLDTLWMMDLKEEFEEAVDAVKKIDFTTSRRNDIPLFETVIRYLGGLIGAYDMSEGKYQILLDKAVELAEILMGAFDTPNRMPMTYYLWKPTFASQPHRAKTRVVLAELGSMSLEFTRLAQITKDAKYYDAVARITNELEILQAETQIPGLWPVSVDASGCKKADLSMAAVFPMPGENDVEKPLGLLDAGSTANEFAMAQEELTEGGAVEKLGRKPSNKTLDVKNRNSVASSLQPTLAASSVKTSLSSKVTQSAKISQDRDQLKKRDAAASTSSEPFEPRPSKKPDCEPQGLASPPHSTTEQFGVGGLADSTYEYLPKEYMLLGGLEEKYRSMYEFAADTMIDRLLFRPMLPDEDRSILGAGIYKANGREDSTDRLSKQFTPEGSHLTCFVGGMFGVGSKIFQRPDDLDRAKKLTDGCVWAYESTETGIMPETFIMVPCQDSRDCPWNETYWRDSLDPNWESREHARAQQLLTVQEISASRASKDGTQTVATSATGTETNRAAETSGLSLKDEVSYSRTEDQARRSSAIVSTTQDQPSTATQSTTGVEPLSTSRSSNKSNEKRQLEDLGANRDEPSKVEKAGLVKETNAGTNEATSSASTFTHSRQSFQASATTSKPSVEELAAADYTQLPLSTSKSENAYVPPPIPSREEFVANRIKNERLPIGMNRINDRKYILRPEAIESVFIMYRITGDNYWREKGWKMFEAVEKHTKTIYGASAINDVTSEEPFKLDEMESFWLAETLKYYYLLYSDPSFVSLDDYVLNTEAHPFKRPKPSP